MSAQRARSTPDKARELQRALYRAAKASPTRRFHALYDKVYRKDVLAKAWQEVKENAGAAGIDEQTIEHIEQSGIEEFLEDLATELREGRYRPRAVRRVRIPKPDGRQRLLGVPTIRDRTVQAAAKVVLEPIFEAEFRPSSYGFRTPIALCARSPMECRTRRPSSLPTSSRPGTAPSSTGACMPVTWSPWSGAGRLG